MKSLRKLCDLRGVTTNFININSTMQTLKELILRDLLETNWTTGEK
jgi:hypothetical protein